MRLKLTPFTLVALSVAFGSLLSTSAPAWAKGGKTKSDKDGDVPDSINKQFKWEEGVVGKNEKMIDHNKIAAMQAAARKEDASHKNEPGVKRAERPAGVGVPASSTLPTMDIEKAAPVAARTPKAHAAAPAPRSRDSLDQLLDSEKDGSGRSHGDGGLGKVLAVSDRSPSSTGASSAGSSPHESVSMSGKAKAKHGHHAH
jgi:hypothetical protein